jgi:hypothetical protein
LKDNKSQEARLSIVDTLSEKDAEEKLRNHYEKMNSEFSVTYWININYCNEIIK